MPAAQFWHVLLAVAAEAVEYKPALQGTQLEAAEAPEPPKYVPAVQFWHVLATTAAEAVEYVPEPQLTQPPAVASPNADE